MVREHFFNSSLNFMITRFAENQYHFLLFLFSACRSNCVMDHTYQTDGGAALCGQGRCACTENYTGDICELDRCKLTDIQCRLHVCYTYAG